ncbi:exo-1,3-beta-glucanase [Phlyctochytrium planicorne]|nr:exo-1,3-beta-glucanase [Phlyctochytrium planicorne]
MTTMLLRTLSLLTLLSLRCDAAKFFYVGTQQPPNDATIIFSSFPVDQSGCIRNGNIQAAAQQENCCSIRPIANLNSYTAMNLSRACSFAPLSMLMKSGQGWNGVSVFGLTDDSSGNPRVQNAQLNQVNPSQASFQLDKMANFMCSPPDAKENGGGGGGDNDGPNLSQAAIWSTTIDKLSGSDTSEMIGEALSAPLGNNDVVFNIDATVKLQEMLGFGAAMTQSSAKVLLETKKRNKAQYEAILRSFFDPKTGLGMYIIRIAIGPCDFSDNGAAFYDGTPNDSNVKSGFNIDISQSDRDYVLPVLQDIKNMGYKFTLYTEAWALPFWMGSDWVRNSWYAKFNDAFADQAGEYFARAAYAWVKLGFDVRYVGMINEPLVGQDAGGKVGFLTKPYQEAAMAKSIRRVLNSVGMTASKIVGYAHNWDQPGYPIDLLKNGGPVDVISWHCYGGEPSAMDQVRAAFPNVLHIMGECTPYTGQSPAKDEYWFSTQPNSVKTLYQDSIEHGLSAVIEWNIVLERVDNTGLIFHNRGCDTCRGMINSLESTGYSIACATPEYFGMRHYAPFVRPGSHRVGMSLDGGGGCVYGHAFLTGGGSVVVVAHNMCGAKKTVGIKVKTNIGEAFFRATLVSGSSTVRIGDGNDIAPRFQAGSGDACQFQEKLIEDKPGYWSKVHIKSRAGHGPGSVGLCLDTVSSTGAHFCFGENPNQLFSPSPVEPGFTLLSAKGKCLRASEMRDGAPARFVTCNPADGNQVWRVNENHALKGSTAPDGHLWWDDATPYRFQPKSGPSFCLDIEADGMKAQIWSCHNGPSQAFDFLGPQLGNNFNFKDGNWANDPVGKTHGCEPNCWVHIRDMAKWPTQLCLDDRGGKTDDGDWTQGYHCYFENTNQKWDILPHPYVTNGFHIAKGGTDYRNCLGLFDNIPFDSNQGPNHGQAGDKVMMRSCNLHAHSQIWFYVDPSNGEKVDVTKVDRYKPGGKGYVLRNYANGLALAFEHTYSDVGGQEGMFKAVLAGGEPVVQFRDMSVAAVLPYASESDLKAYLDANPRHASIHLKNKVEDNRLCLDIRDGKHDDGDWVQGYFCFSENDNQKWNLLPVPSNPESPHYSSGTNRYLLQSAAYPSQCLGLWAGDPSKKYQGDDWNANGSRMVIQKCNVYSANQRFAVGKAEDSANLKGLELIVEASKKCLDVEMTLNPPSPGDPVEKWMYKLHQWECTGGVNQRFDVLKGEEADDPVKPCKDECNVQLFVENYADGQGQKCLKKKGDGFELSRCSKGSKDQMWSMHRMDNGFLQISDNNKMCIARGGDWWSEIKLVRCSVRRQDQWWERAQLPDFSMSWPLNFGMFKEKSSDGNQNNARCLSLDGKDGWKVPTMQPCGNWNNRDIPRQVWRVYGKGGISGNGRDTFYEHLFLDSQPQFKTPQGAFNYHNNKIRGIGLGGWLVYEPFMTSWYGYLKYNDEEDFARKNGEALEAHWNTFVKEEDVKKMADNGINHVRIPVGWWSIPGVDLTGYGFRTGALKYFDRMVGWCRKYGIKIILDLHATKGQQNPWNHSGRRGQRHFFDSVDNFWTLIDGLKTLADRYEKDVDTVTAIEVLNEPRPYSNQELLMLDWINAEAYKRLRYRSDGTPREFWIQIQEAFQSWRGDDNYYVNRWNVAGGYHRVMLDVHYYQVFDTSLQTLSIDQRKGELCNVGRDLAFMNSRIFYMFGVPLFHANKSLTKHSLLPQTKAGEFSGAITWCDAPFLSDVPDDPSKPENIKESKWPANGGTIDNCATWKSLYKSDSDPEWLANAKEWNRGLIKQFIEAQIVNFEKGSGWVFWGAKTFGAQSWDWSWLLDQGMFPKRFDGLRDYC